MISLVEPSYIATIIGVIFNILLAGIAVVTYVGNVKSQIRERSIQNAQRYIDAMSKFTEPTGFIMSHVKQFEKFDQTKKDVDRYVRNPSNEVDEKLFNRLLGSCEHMAILQSSGAFPATFNAYMLGWFCRHISGLLTPEEKSNKFWALAVDFLEQTSNEANDLENKNLKDRLEYLKKNHFIDLTKFNWLERKIGLSGLSQ